MAGKRRVMGPGGKVGAERQTTASPGRLPASMLPPRASAEVAGCGRGADPARERAGSENSEVQLSESLEGRATVRQAGA